MTRGEARRSPRPAEYAYNEPDLYFVTMCTSGHEPILGDVAAGEVRLSRAGEVVQAEWEGLPERLPGLELDAFVIMPNHVPGIIMLGSDPGLARGGDSPSLPRVMRAFKSASGIAGNKALDRRDRPFWQRSYHDRIVRNDRELALIRAYIADNPTCWEMGIDNPAAPGPSSAT